jgi:hypothetical protein
MSYRVEFEVESLLKGSHRCLATMPKRASIVSRVGMGWIPVS